MPAGKKNTKPDIIRQPEPKKAPVAVSPFSLQNILFGKESVHFIQDYPFPVERIFSFFARHENWAKIFPGAFKRVADSTDPRNINGVGSVRRIITFPLIFEETITRFQEPFLIEYRISSPSPLKNHLGQMKFISTSADTCRLDYTISFEPVIPATGFLLKNTLERAVGNGIREVATLLRENPNL